MIESPLGKMDFGSEGVLKDFQNLQGSFSEEHRSRLLKF